MTRPDPALDVYVTQQMIAPAKGTAVVVPEVRLTHAAVSLGNRILAGLKPGDVLLICGLTSHRGVGDLAMMTARAVAGLSGLRVLLVQAQSLYPAALLPHVPDGALGYTDLLAGSPVTPAMLHAAPDSPVQVVGLGTRPELAGANSLMAATVGSAVAALQAQTEILCLVGAPMRQSVGTASLARQAQTSLLCVHSAVDRREEVAQAVTDFGATGTHLLGTVLLH